MLDLNKLEKKLDIALEKETEESLKKWLMKKKQREDIPFLGEGEFMEELEKISEKYKQKQVKVGKVVNVKKEDNVGIEYCYNLAA